MSRSRADYVLFLDAGDVLLPTAVQSLLDTALVGAYAAVTAPVVRVTQAGVKVDYLNERRELVVHTGCGALGDGGGLYHNCYGTHNALVLQSAYERVGGYRKDE